MKAILVFTEMPKSCDECEVRCGGYTAKEYSEKSIKRPSWCPLKPMPQKKKPMDPDETWEELHQRWGYNACLEDITGETE